RSLSPRRRGVPLPVARADAATRSGRRCGCRTSLRTPPSCSASPCLASRGGTSAPPTSYSTLLPGVLYRTTPPSNDAQRARADPGIGGVPASAAGRRRRRRSPPRANRLRTGRGWNQHPPPRLRERGEGVVGSPPPPSLQVADCGHGPPPMILERFLAVT